MQFIYLLLALALFNSSSKEFISVEHTVYNVQSFEVDSTLYNIVSPYKAELDAQMNAILCYSEVAMKKGKPESLLGNWTSDVCLEIAQELYSESIEVSFFNTGGLRSSLPKGNISKRELFQLMPFENELVVLELNQHEILGLKNYFIETEGQPIAFSSKFNLNDTIFHVLTTDYLANGGDKMSFFKDKIQHKIGLKMRDALINYCVKKDSITSALDERHLILFNDN